MSSPRKRKFTEQEEKDNPYIFWCVFSPPFWVFDGLWPYKKSIFFLPLCWGGGGFENKSKPTDPEQTPLNRDSIIHIMVFYRINRRINLWCPCRNPVLPPAFGDPDLFESQNTGRDLRVSSDFRGQVREVTCPSFSHWLRVGITLGLLSFLSCLFLLLTPCCCPAQVWSPQFLLSL